MLPFFFSSRRRHTRFDCDWSSDVCSSDLKYHTELRRRLDADPQIRRYFDQETTEIPEFYVKQVRRDLGPLWQWLPAGGPSPDPPPHLKRGEPNAPQAGRGGREGDTAARPRHPPEP